MDKKPLKPQVEKALEPIIQYKMNPLEAKAFKVCLLWDCISDREVPQYKLVKSKKNGDPRQSILFKYCYKLVNETKGLIEDNQYRLYINAQFQWLKTRKQGEVHALLGPHILCGQAAWWRWTKWKDQYDSQIGARTTEAMFHQGQKVEPGLIKQELRTTKKFFLKLLNGEMPDQRQMDLCIRERRIRKWVEYSQVSPYYCVLSPLVAKSLETYPVTEALGIDMNVYKPHCSDEILNYFKTEFSSEFGLC